MSAPINSNLLTPHKKPWYRRAWFITLAVLAIIWFGLPQLANLLAPVDQPLGFTAAPGAGSVETGEQSDLATADAASLGSPVAPIVIVEFGDFECPFCREAAPIVKELSQRYPEAVRLVYRHFPVVDIHQNALAAAEAAACAEVQGKFWAYHDGLFQAQDQLGEELYQALARSLALNLEDFNRCREQHLTLTAIRADFEAGAKAGVRGTPTWFVNGHRLEGALSLELWEQVVVGVLRSLFPAQPTP